MQRRDGTHRRRLSSAAFVFRLCSLLPSSPSPPHCSSLCSSLSFSRFSFCFVPLPASSLRSLHLLCVILHFSLSFFLFFTFFCVGSSAFCSVASPFSFAVLSVSPVIGYSFSRSAFSSASWVVSSAFFSAFSALFAPRKVLLASRRHNHSVPWTLLLYVSIRLAFICRTRGLQG